MFCMHNIWGLEARFKSRDMSSKTLNSHTSNGKNQKETYIIEQNYNNPNFTILFKVTKSMDLGII
jgi:hypothetical protein